MRTRLALVLWLACAVCHAQAPVDARPHALAAAYPESESAAAWRALASSYVRKALHERKVDRDPALNARVDGVMTRVGAALASLDRRFAESQWKAILIEDFGHGAVAFPGETVLVDSTFVRSLALSDDELALVLSHEVAHVVAGHAYQKLSFMAETLGRDRAPTARAALLEFLARDQWARAFRPVARLQEREADRVGAGILKASGYDAQRALGLFDKLARREDRSDADDSHDSAAARRAAVESALGNATGSMRPGSSH